MKSLKIIRLASIVFIIIMIAGCRKKNNLVPGEGISTWMAARSGTV